MTREEAAKYFENRLKSVSMPGAREAFEQAIAALKAPERKHGYWIKTDRWFEARSYFEIKTCSCCHTDVGLLNSETFCPECGGAMDEEVYDG